MRSARFPIRFGSWYRRLSSALFLGPSESYVEIVGDEVRVQMSWAFRMRFPRAAVRSVAPFEGPVLSRGVHGFGKRWLVNGSGDGIVSLQLEPAQRATTMGIPVSVQELLVSVEEPGAVMDALRRGNT